MIKSIVQKLISPQIELETPYFPTERPLNQIKDYPGPFIWLAWLSILILDLILRAIGNHKIAPLEIILVHFFGGGFILQFWFFSFLPQIFIFKKWLKVTVQLILIFLFFYLIKLYLLKFWSEDEISLIQFLTSEIGRFFHHFIFISAMWSFYIMAKKQETLKEMEIDLIKLQVEHKSLQLSPHFTLNMISHILVELKSLSMPMYKILSKFTTVLSYSFKSLDAGNSLAQEIHAVNSYIECQKYRFKKNLQFLLTTNFNILEVQNLPMPKWILMTLVENIFKHGDCNSESHPCMITMNLFSEQNGSSVFDFFISNKIKKPDHSKHSGFGISAVKRILDHYFPNNYQLQNEIVGDDFKLSLKISYPN